MFQLTPDYREHTDVDKLNLNGKCTAFVYKLLEGRRRPRLAENSLCVRTITSIEHKKIHIEKCC